MPIAEIHRQADNQGMPQDRQHHHQKIAAISRIPLETPSSTRIKQAPLGQATEQNQATINGRENLLYRR